MVINATHFDIKLEEQKIELEGTKARLRQLNRPSPPAVVSVQVRAVSMQTEAASTSSVATIKRSHQSTQTESDSKSNRLLPRVIDSSPKGKLCKSNPNDNQITISWDDDDRPSVERRSFSSRIPTPIKLQTPPKLTAAFKSDNGPQSVNNNHHVVVQTGTRATKRLDNASGASPVLPSTASTKNNRIASTKSRDTSEAKVQLPRPAKQSFWGAWWKL